MTATVIKKKLALVPDEYLNEISEYIDFILFRIQEKKIENFKRSPGIMKEKVYMSKDFDAPLYDFKEYM